MFGKKSPLVGADEAMAFMNYFDNLMLCPISNSGMRILEENHVNSYAIINNFLKENI